MTAMKTFTIHIHTFCDCYGCVEKLKKTLKKLDNDVEFLAMDPSIGKFTISTSEHHKVVKDALKLAFPYREITVIHHSNPVSVPNFSFDAAAKALVTLSQVEGLENVELKTKSRVKGSDGVKHTQSNDFKLNFKGNPHNQPTHSSLPPTLHNAPPQQPPADVKPSAPPIPPTPYVVYEYPPTFHNAPPQQPPPNVKPSTPPIPPTPYVVYGCPPTLPNSRPQYVKPSAPPIPPNPYVVYGYPPEFYGFTPK